MHDTYTLTATNRQKGTYVYTSWPLPLPDSKFVQIFITGTCKHASVCKFVQVHAITSIPIAWTCTNLHKLACPSNKNLNNFWIWWGKRSHISIFWIIHWPLFRMSVVRTTSINKKLPERVAWSTTVLLAMFCTSLVTLASGSWIAKLSSQRIHYATISYACSLQNAKVK